MQHHQKDQEEEL